MRNVESNKHPERAKQLIHRSGQSLWSAALCLALGSALVAVPLVSPAQTLDDVQVKANNGDAVIRIKFNGRIRYVRATPVTQTDQVLVYFQIISLDDPNAIATVEEAKVSPNDAPGPAFTVAYPYQPTQLVRQLRVQFASKVTVQVRPGAGDRSIEVVVKGGVAKTAQPKPGDNAGSTGAPATGGVTAPGVSAAATAPPAARTIDRFALTLQRVAAGNLGAVKPVPRELEKFEVFTSPLGGTGGGFEVDVGYFADEAAAEAVRQKVLATFPDAVVFDAEQRKLDNLSTVSQKPIAATTDGAPPPADRQAIDAKADELLLAAADAVTAKNYGAAIDSLNQVLLLPPNASSQTAEELLGVAQERSGDTASARQAYNLYLKLFPEGEGPDRVRQRLANLSDAPIPPSPSAATPPAEGVSAADAASAPLQDAAKRNVAAQKNISGSISQFYYGGQTRSTTLLNVPTGINQTTLAGTTQSAIVTNIDATARYRDADTDSRMVLRDTNSASLLHQSQGSRGTNLLSAAFIDYKNLATSLGVRVGRQSGASAGAIGLFDGITVGYSVSPKLRVNLSAGQPSDPLTASHQRFEGFDVQADEVFPNVGLGLYGINQTVDGAVSRRALGLEARYFTPHYSIYANSDYDTAFKATNSSVLQGTMTTDNQEVISILVDHRRIPGLDLGNALIGSNFTSLQVMLQQLGYSQVQQLAAQIAAISRQTVGSFSKPISEHWQASADVRWADVGPLPALGNAPAQPGTGSQLSYSLVATGSNLYSQRDTNVFNLSVLTSATLHGTQLSYNNLTGLMENALSFEPSLRLYVENNNTGLHTTRWTPGVRASYRITPVASFETEAILEVSKVTGASSTESTTNAFYYLGYRYDFR